MIWNVVLIIQQAVRSARFRRASGHSFASSVTLLFCNWLTFNKTEFLLSSYSFK